MKNNKQTATTAAAIACSPKNIELFLNNMQSDIEQERDSEHSTVRAITTATPTTTYFFYSVSLARTHTHTQHLMDDGPKSKTKTLAYKIAI